MKLIYLASGLLRLCRFTCHLLTKPWAATATLDGSLSKGEMWFTVIEVDYKYRPTPSLCPGVLPLTFPSLQPSAPALSIC